MSLLTDFVIKQLEDKKQQRWVIPSKDLFDLLSKMGIMHQEDYLMDILEYLEENNIDVHFENPAYEAQFSVFKKIEMGYKLRKHMKDQIDENKIKIEKVLSIKPKVNDSFLLEYMTDDEEDQKIIKEKYNKVFDEDGKVNSLNEFQEKIKMKINQEMLENAPPIDNTLIEFIRNNS